MKGDEPLYSIDINGCRRNICKHSNFEFPVYSVLDNWEEFDGFVECGNYYIETDNYEPFHKNGIYNEALVKYGLELGIITLDDIKYQFKPAHKLSTDYFHGLLDFIEQVCQVDNPQGSVKYPKFACNSMIGAWGRRNSTFILNDYSHKDDIDTMAGIYQKFSNPFINAHGDVLSITDERIVQKLETNFYLHSHILDIEAIELHKLHMLVKQTAIPLCCKTDCVVFARLDKFTLPSIEGHYWDENKTVKKYKFEDDTHMLKKGFKLFCNHPMIINPTVYEEYLHDDIYKDDSFEHITDVILQAEKGCFIEGEAGVGKSYILKKLNSKLVEGGKKVLRLAPTNKAARIIDGETLDKFCRKTLNSQRAIKVSFANTDVIIVDEISMVRETFYQLLIMIKHSYPNIQFIIAGHFEQLLPVNDRVSNRCYKSSRVLYELVDGMRLTLTVCKRSDASHFNQCRRVLENKPIDLSLFPPRFTWLHLTYTNKRRMEINKAINEKFMEKANKMVYIPRLEYDDNSQEYYLCEGARVIARKTDASLGVFNNETFTVAKIKKDSVVLTDVCDKSVEIPIKRFQYYFHLAWAITIHKSQGATFDQPYTIHEWKLLNKRLRYVSLSRATDTKCVGIC
jgi:hypothetical protein